MESACTRVNCVFFDHISGTATGRLVVCSGGSFGGKIASRRFCQRLPNPAFQLTSRSEFTDPRGARRNSSLKFEPVPSPKLSGTNTAAGPPRNLTRRSVRKSLRLEKKFFSSDCWVGESKRPIFRVGSAGVWLELLIGVVKSAIFRCLE